MHSLHQHAVKSMVYTNACFATKKISTAPERSVCLHLMFVLSVFTNQMYHSNIMVPSCWKSMSSPWKPVRNTEHRFDKEIDVVRGSITHNMCNFRYRICTGVITLCLQSYLPLQHRTHGFIRKRSMVFVAVATRLGQRFATAFRGHLASLCLLAFVIMDMRTMCRQTSVSWHRYLFHRIQQSKNWCGNKQHSFYIHRNVDVCSDHV